VSVGQKTLTIDKGLDLTLSTAVVLVNNSAQMQGSLFSYDPVTGVMLVNVTEIKGTGTYNAWFIAVYTGSTSYATAEGSPDNLVAIATIHNELWLVGSETTEVWYNNGQPGFPFQRIHGDFFNNGTIAPHSVVNNGSNLFWLGSSAGGHGMVFMANGYQPAKISSNSIDFEIENLKNIQDAIGWCYTQNGHEFYVLSFIQGNRTFCYDVSTNEWHERAYYNPTTGKNERHRAICETFAFGKCYVGDRVNQNIYELALDDYTDNGDIVRRVRTGPHIHSDRKRLFYKEFEVDIERGVGLDGVGQGTDPFAFLTWSDDGGRTWSNEYWGSLGKIGEYNIRLHWHRLGMSRDRVFRLVVSDPNKVVLIDARADVGSEK